MRHEFYIERARFGNPFVARLTAGDDLIKRVSEIVRLKEARRVIFLSAIGSLCNVKLRNFKDGAELPLSSQSYMIAEAKGPFMLLSLEGSIFPEEGQPTPHLHCLLGSSNGVVIGGHLISAQVFASVEMVCAEIERSWSVRSPDPNTGMSELVIAQ